MVNDYFQQLGITFTGQRILSLVKDHYHWSVNTFNGQGSLSLVKNHFTGQGSPISQKSLSLQMDDHLIIALI